MPTHRLTTRALATLALTFGGGLLLAACGDDEEPVDAQTPSTEEMDESEQMDESGTMDESEPMDGESEQMDEEP